MTTYSIPKHILSVLLMANLSRSGLGKRKKSTSHMVIQGESQPPPDGNRLTTLWLIAEIAIFSFQDMMKQQSPLVAVQHGSKHSKQSIVPILYKISFPHIVHVIWQSQPFVTNVRFQPLIPSFMHNEPPALPYSHQDLALRMDNLI